MTTDSTYLKLLTALARVQPPKGAEATLRKMLDSAVLLHTPFNRCKIRCIETGEVYEGVVHAAVQLKCSKGYVSNHLYGRIPSVRGKHLERVT